MIIVLQAKILKIAPCVCVLKGKLARTQWPCYGHQFVRFCPKVAVQIAVQGAIRILFYVDCCASMSRAPSCCDEILDCAQNDNTRNWTQSTSPNLQYLFDLAIQLRQMQPRRRIAHARFRVAYIALQNT